MYEEFHVFQTFPSHSCFEGVWIPWSFSPVPLLFWVNEDNPVLSLRLSRLETISIRNRWRQLNSSLILLRFVSDSDLFLGWRGGYCNYPPTWFIPILSVIFSYKTIIFLIKGNCSISSFTFETKLSEVEASENSVNWIKKIKKNFILFFIMSRKDKNSIIVNLHSLFP